jgi:hypothetical protein
MKAEKKRLFLVRKPGRSLWKSIMGVFRASRTWLFSGTNTQGRDARDARDTGFSNRSVSNWHFGIFTKSSGICVLIGTVVFADLQIEIATGPKA